MYLFDTDSISNLLKKKPSEKFVDSISRVDKSDQFISTITLGELVYGAFKSNKSQFYLDYLNNILLPSVNVLGFDISAAFIYGKIRAALSEDGIIISNSDMQIASIAIANNMILVTGNTKHFIHIQNLQIENWFY
jgi:tRNA(fMet)-specific endonuclease VapC